MVFVADETPTRPWEVDPVAEHGLARRLRSNLNRCMGRRSDRPTPQIKDRLPMTSPRDDILGVDVAKGWIDVFSLATGARRRITTAPAALARFAGAATGALVVFEASGGCERPLAAALARAGVPFARVTPRQARDFARATGKLAKTDRVDAEVLARMGQALELPPTPPEEPGRARLADLLARRDDLAGRIRAEKNRAAAARDPWMPAGSPGCCGSSNVISLLSVPRSRPSSPPPGRWPPRPGACARPPASGRWSRQRTRRLSGSGGGAVKGQGNLRQPNHTPRACRAAKSPTFSPSANAGRWGGSMPIAIYLLLTLGLGVIVSFQPLMNAVLARALGSAYGAAGISLAVAALGAVALVTVAGRGDMSRATLASVPWWISISPASSAPSSSPAAW